MILFSIILIEFNDQEFVFQTTGQQRFCTNTNLFSTFLSYVPAHLNFVCV